MPETDCTPPRHRATRDHTITPLPSTSTLPRQMHTLPTIQPLPNRPPFHHLHPPRLPLTILRRHWLPPLEAQRTSATRITQRRPTLPWSILMETRTSQHKHHIQNHRRPSHRRDFTHTSQNHPRHHSLMPSTFNLLHRSTSSSLLTNIIHPPRPRKEQKAPKRLHRSRTSFFSTSLLLTQRTRTPRISRQTLRTRLRNRTPPRRTRS